MLAAFLEDILADPDDDIPRLILADWLQDHGGDWGPDCAAFIRAQCRLAALGWDDPDRPALEAVELLHERTLAQRLVPWPRRWVRRWTFHRGLIEEVALTGARLLAHGDELFRRAPIRQVRVFLDEGDGPKLRESPWWQSVRALEITGRVSLDLLQSPGLSNLRELVIRGAIPPDLAPLRRLPALEVLDLRGGTLRSLAAPGALAPLQSRPWHILRFPSGWTRPNAPNYQPARDLILAAAETLEELVLENWPIAELRPLLAFRGWKRLRCLTLGGVADLGRSVVSDVLQAPLLAGLERLALTAMRIGDPELGQLARCSGLSGLVHLDLAHCTPSAGGIRALVSSPYLSELRRLSLRHPNPKAATDPAALALVGAMDLPHLGVLDLSGWKLSAGVARTLLAAPWVEQVHNLDLRQSSAAPTLERELLARGPWPRLGRLSLSFGTSALRERFGERLRY